MSRNGGNPVYHLCVLGGRCGYDNQSVWATFTRGACVLLLQQPVKLGCGSMQPAHALAQTEGSPHITRWRIQEPAERLDLRFAVGRGQSSC